MNVQHLADRNQIVNFSVGSWGTRKLNKTETAKIRAANGSDAASVIVRVCDNPILDEIKRGDTALRNVHTSLTHPTCQDGMRLLRKGKALEHANAVSEWRAKREPLVAQFLDDYPAIADAAPTILNGLYDPSAWPTLRAMRNKFPLTCQYLSCPVDGAWTEWLESSASAACSELRDQIEEAVKHVADRCASDGKLYATVFTGLRELLECVPDLDIAPDSEIARLAALATPLASYDAESLRDNDAQRHDVASQARDALAFFGPGSLASF